MMADSQDQIVDLAEYQILSKKGNILYTGELSGSQRNVASLLEESDLEAPIYRILKPKKTDHAKWEDILLKAIRNKNFLAYERPPVAERKDVSTKFLESIPQIQGVKPKSLSAVIEEDYRRAMKIVTDPVVDPEKENIRKEIVALFAELDVLSSFNFAPLRVNTTPPKTGPTAPALFAEEIGPSAYSSALQIAGGRVSEKTGKPQNLEQILLRPTERYKARKEMSKSKMKRKRIKKSRAYSKKPLVTDK